MVFPTISQSKIVWDCGGTITGVVATFNFTGTIRFYVAADGNTETWEEIVGLTTGIPSTHNFTTTGSQLKWKTVGVSGAQISYIKLEVQT